MDTTFISIHDLSFHARLLYVSNSITDILGYNPEDVVGKSCWEYFHPDEVPFARAIHGRGVELDKAAVLNYCRIKNKAGDWVGCECVFTIVHDVLVGCTSIYRTDAKSQRRANDAPIIRQLFSSSPKDPRYHMLSYISAKFSQGPKSHIHEPRAALFVNRFTRTLTVMYATNGLAPLLGITSQELVGKSFYFCIQENCLPEAVRCLENAKANDSIAYLRFWYRDPRRQYTHDEDENLSDAPSSDQDSEEGGVRLNMGLDGNISDENVLSASSSDQYARSRNSIGHGTGTNGQSRTSSGTDADNGSSIFDRNNRMWQSSTSSLSVDGQGTRPSQANPQANEPHIELEAVISCTSDGLVVIIREARPFVLDSLRPPQKVAQPPYANGFFASPWSQEPMISGAQHCSDSFSIQDPGTHSPSYFEPRAATATVQKGPPVGAFWQSIRECAVFAWGLTGINGSLAQYSRGAPDLGAQPPDGLPVWERDADQMKAHMRSPVEDYMEE